MMDYDDHGSSRDETILKKERNRKNEHTEPSLQRNKKKWDYIISSDRWSCLTWTSGDIFSISSEFFYRQTRDKLWLELRHHKNVTNFCALCDKFLPVRAVRVKILNARSVNTCPLSRWCTVQGGLLHNTSLDIKKELVVSLPLWNPG